VATAYEPAWVDEDAEAEVGRAIEAVRALRGWRERVGVRPGALVPARLEAEGYGDTLATLVQLARLDLSPDGGDPVASVTVPGGAVQVLAGGEFDPAAAERRRDERRAKLQADIDRSQAKLANPAFVERAPADVVEAERAKLARLRKEAEEL
jgi:valyl-tRNA synthetase